MGYFPVMHDSRVIIYKRKMFIRLATALYLEEAGGAKARRSLFCLDCNNEILRPILLESVIYLVPTWYLLGTYLVPTWYLLGIKLNLSVDLSKLEINSRTE